MLVNNCIVTLMHVFKIVGSRAILVAQRVVNRAGCFLALRKTWREIRQREIRVPHLQHPQPSLGSSKACKPERTLSACSVQNILWHFPFPYSLSTDFSESSCIFSTLLHLLPVGQNPLICHNKIVWWPERSVFYLEVLILWVSTFNFAYAWEILVWLWLEFYTLLL